MEITQYDHQTWIFYHNGVRFFLLEGDEKAALIDTGMHAGNVFELVKERTEKPVILLNTHADMDHVGANEEADEVWLSPYEMAHYAEIIRKKQILHALFPGDEIDLGNRVLRIIDLSGHTPGSIGFLDLSRRVLISGDPIQRNGNVYMFGLYRNIPACIASLKRLQNHTGEFDQIWPSHADFPLNPDIISDVLADFEMIENGYHEGETREMHGRTVFACRTDTNVYLINE